MGTPSFAVPSLDILVRHGHPISAVVTGPDKPRGRGLEITPTAVKARALEFGLPILQPEGGQDTRFATALRALTPDIIVVVAFRILPREIFSLSRLGTFNLHASLLPRYRGAAPINWALIRGERETGVTTFFLEEKVDTGLMILQERIPISPEDDAGALHDKLSLLGADVVLRTVRAIESGDPPRVPQDHSLASPAPKLTREDCHLRWNTPSNELVNRIRGLSPHPAAFTLHGGKVLKLYRARAVLNRSDLAPGQLFVEGGMLFIGTADGALAVEELQQEGRKRMTSAEFLRGYRFEENDVVR